MATPLQVVHKSEKVRQGVVDVLEDFLQLAREGGLCEVMVVGISGDEREIIYSASGSLRVSEQVGCLERMKHRLLSAED